MKKSSKKSPVSAVCSTLGTVILILVIVFCIPITLPRTFGYQVYSVISGSMEPAISTGSLVYIRTVEPEEVEVDEVIAYYGGRDTNAIITHRVVENRVVMGEFITKGDANETNDMNPVAYDDVIGKVTLSIPKLGSVAQLLTSLQGKIAAGSAILLAVILHILANVLNREKSVKENDET